MIKFKAFLLILSTVFVLSNENGNNPNITGKWTMCAQGTDDNMILSNVCADIIFSEDGTGVVKMGDEIRSTFQWEIDSKTINFSFKSEEDKRNFLTPSNSLKYKIYRERGFEYFKLMEIDHDYWYRLIRNIK